MFMTPLTQAGMLVINTLFGLYLLVVILRFLLQLVRADFYNPISQFIVKATNPPLIPLRKMIPGWGGIDIASLVLALLVQAIAIVLILLLNGIQPPLQVALWAAIGVLSLILKVYFWGLLITVIASWIAPNSYNPALILINQILEPAMKPIRKMMPDMGGLDISPIIMFLGIQVLEILVVQGLVQASGMPARLVLGV
jgi:YggT family protein|tara:strand:- start:462 stop:1052 length:591 start_codon:yes stop_codon:yes gene_type:complete